MSDINVSPKFPAFAFKLATDMRFGIGMSGNISAILAEYGLRKLCVIVDAALVNGSGAVPDLIKNLRRLPEVVRVYENKMAEPDYDYLDGCKKELAASQFDSVMGIGGGSTLDLAKGLAALMTNPGDAIAYKGFNLVKTPALPVIAVPTTAGTGSEVTPTAVFIDKREKRKLGINTEYVRPKVAILDPALTVSCPKGVTVSSGMDALAHALESFVSRRATPTSKLFSAEAFSLLFNNLAKVLDNMNNVEIRAGLLLGSYYAGIALMNSGAAAAHALSYPLGVLFNVPHGLAGGVFLPPVVKLNVEKGSLAYAPLYDLIEGAERNLSEVEKSRRFVKAVADLCQRLSVPASLKSFGVAAKDVDALLADSLMWRKEAIEQNPVSLSQEEIRGIWASMV